MLWFNASSKSYLTYLVFHPESLVLKGETIVKIDHENHIIF